MHTCENSNPTLVFQTRSSFLIEPGKRFELAAAADISIGQASLHETLVDQNRSSLKIHYTSIEDDDEDEDEDQTSKDIKDDETKASVIANFIPGAVSIFFPFFMHVLDPPDRLE